MQNIIVYVLNLLFLAGGVLLIRRGIGAGLHPAVFWVAFVFKLCCGLLLGLLYMYHYQGGDTWFYFDQAWGLAQLDWESFWSEISEAPESSQAVRAIWFTRLVAVGIYVWHVDYWLCGMYFSLFSFCAGIYAVVRFSEWNESFQWPAVISFLFFPSVVFWSSGLLKESLAYAALLFVLGFYASYRSRRVIRLLDGAVLILGAVVLVVIKYYIAALLFPAVVFLMTCHVMGRWFPQGGVWSRVVRVGLLWLVPGYLFLYWLSPNFHWGQLWGVIQQNHDMILKQSDSFSQISTWSVGGGMIEWAINLLYFLVSGIFRPMLGETWSFPQVWSALENFALLVYCIYAVTRRFSVNRQYLIEIWSLVAFVVCCAVLLSYSVPNLGTIARYKVYYMPLLLFLILNIPVYLPFLKSKT
ncbi:hypothetical protein BFP72_15520 [Reichenbachiella sp. 5M10]|uniref:hypothetical protein n=1 Tax=Reichenbachiella sp. 5M10 TaxID=1889772 RepID=UPI000C15BD56|nr:hypothetical protein [Reichenbachiella sp. 5M10]PIB36708.1 hypothetical protein BFP72_15520 [Reichenbachiella sp. 5M10]